MSRLEGLECAARRPRVADRPTSVERDGTEPAIWTLNDTESLREDDAMSNHGRTAGARSPSAPKTEKLPRTVRVRSNAVTGTADALYERHLLFDNVVDPGRWTARPIRGVARSVRDVLSQRWIMTEKTYGRQNSKRVYYLSMEFLLGRSLANNVTNLLLDPVVERSSRRSTSTGWACSSRSPTPVLATAGWGAWRRASWTPWRRWGFRPWATGCGTSTGSSGRRSRTAGSTSSPTTGCVGPTPGRSPRP